MIAQTIHAAGESSPGPSLPPDTHAVALAASSEQELLDLEMKLVQAGIPHRAIREPDAPWCGQLMAIGIEPCKRELVQEYTRAFKLVRHQHCKNCDACVT